MDDKFRRKCTYNIFKLVSSLANETLYLVIISFLYWCVSKRKAFYMIVMLCFSGYIGIVIKEFMKIPRPYTYDGIQSLYEKSAVSYSFPSTHVQLATTFWGSFMILCKKNHLDHWYCFYYISCYFSFIFTRTLAQ